MPWKTALGLLQLGRHGRRGDRWAIVDGAQIVAGGVVLGDSDQATPSPPFVTLTCRGGSSDVALVIVSLLDAHSHLPSGAFRPLGLRIHFAALLWHILPEHDCVDLRRFVQAPKQIPWSARLQGRMFVQRPRYVFNNLLNFCRVVRLEAECWLRCTLQAGVLRLRRARVPSRPRSLYMRLARYRPRDIVSYPLANIPPPINQTRNLRRQRPKAVQDSRVGR